MRAGMDTIKVHVPEQYLRNDHNNLYLNVKRALDDRQIWSKELKRVVKQLATAASIENTITLDEE